ncbi:MAG: class I SAM-dependent methyltransferase [Azoarcus sp.]|jgi:SAM-dependent methyltransferase|nr:class I SAM-dependent methyltransferase [Azoarcus sp.]
MSRNTFTRSPRMPGFQPKGENEGDGRQGHFVSCTIIKTGKARLKCAAMNTVADSSAAALRAFRRRLIGAATAPYRSAGHFAWHFARGKLGRDPVFFSLLARGEFPPTVRMTDLGCGQCLLANLLTSAARLFEAGDWPASWPPPPRLESYRGIELMPRDVERARPALPPGAVVEQGDIRHVDFGPANVVVILDSLHYIDHAAQDAVLERARRTLAPDGVLVLRVGDAAAGWPFMLCSWVDHLVTWVRGHRLGQLHCRPAVAWQRKLESLDFRVHPQPMDAGTPFANTLLLARLGNDK